MKLFHSFPRSRTRLQPSGSDGEARSSIEDASIAQNVLLSIFKKGLLCTPEKLKIFPDRQTANPLKQALLRTGAPEYTHIQSRICFTLCDEAELFEPKIRGFVPDASDTAGCAGSLLSHADLFGPCAISFDPANSRRIGILPTTYYSPADIFGGRFHSEGPEAPGLNLQIIQRLKEIRELLIVLATLERSLNVQGVDFPGERVLKSLDLVLPYQKEIMKAVYGLTYAQREKVLTLFNTDREIALTLISFVDIMLSLFQETDSTIDGSMFAFYQQREWRLVHHMRQGMVWYCLGSQPEFRDAFGRYRQAQIQDLRDSISPTGGYPNRSYLDHCWLLESVDERPISAFVSSVIVPSRMCSLAKQAVEDAGSSADVIASEEFGYREK